MAKRTVLFINDSLWRSSGVFLSLLQVLRHISYETYDVTLYVSADARVDPDAVSLLGPKVRLIIGEDFAHGYRDPIVFALHLLSRCFSAVRLRSAADRLQKKARARLRKNKMRRQAKRYFGKIRFNVVVANTVPVCSEIARYVAADKKYVLFHSSKPEFFPELTLRAFRDFDRVIAVSESVKQMLVKTYPQNEEQIEAVANYVDAKNVIDRAAASALPPADDRVRLCSCGRLEKEKGFDLALEAASLLKAQGFEFIWYFVGDGSERPKLTAMRDEAGLDKDIVFAGFRSNPYPYIGGCDIYVQPSYEEAQPLTVMEALILGRAVVSTETVGGRTLLEDGNKGVVTPITAEGLAEGIASLLRDPERRASLENAYTAEDDQNEKQRFTLAWDRLLSE